MAGWPHRRAERAEADVQRKERKLAELAEERRDLVRRLLSASEDERRRVAAEIHDGPTQQVSGAAMLLEAAMSDEGALREGSRVAPAHAYLGAALDETRRIISDLRPPLLDDLGVAEALNRAFRAADHEAVAFLQTPDSPARADVEKLKALLSHRRGTTHAVAIIRIAAIDQDVATVQ